MLGYVSYENCSAYLVEVVFECVTFFFIKGAKKKKPFTYILVLNSYTQNWFLTLGYWVGCVLTIIQNKKYKNKWCDKRNAKERIDFYKFLVPQVSTVSLTYY